MINNNCIHKSERAENTSEGTIPGTVVTHNYESHNHYTQSLLWKAAARENDALQINGLTPLNPNGKPK